jgi:hypothetical protein
LAYHIKEGHRLRVFENRVLKKLFDLTSDDLERERRRLHNDVLNDLHSSQTIIRVIESRRMRWARHVARMEEKTGVHRILFGNPRNEATWKT